MPTSADCFTAQHLVASLEQIVAAGLSGSAVTQRVAAGRLHRLHRAVFSCVAASQLRPEGRYLAAVLACGPTAALSHRSAADLHGLRDCHRAAVEVIVPGRSTRRHAGVEVHRSVRLGEKDLAAVDGIRVTCVARTLLDLAGVVPPRVLHRALDEAEVLRVFDLVALRDQVARNPGHPGAGALRRELDRQDAGTTVTFSEFEERFYVVADAAGLPRPEVNAYVDPGDGGPPIRPDFTWRAQKLALELDGAGVHRISRRFESDRARDRRLTLAGWRPVRITWHQLNDDPAAVIRDIRQLLDA